MIQNLSKQVEDAIKNIETLNESLNKVIEQNKALEEIIQELNKTTPKLNTTITLNNINAQVGEITTITANLKDQNQKALTSGKVIFKVNGVTLKDDNKNIIYAYVNNGTASINYKVPSTWIKNTTTIQAVYSGSEKYNASRSTPSSSPLNITKGDVNITFMDTKIIAQSGDQITIRTILTDSNGERITSGKVSFKLNGVTLKDENGKAITASIKDGIATLNYTIPETYRVKDYKITAVFGSDYYNRAEQNATITLTKKATTVTTSSITTSNGKTTIKGTITDNNGKLMIIPSKMVVKVNGKTILSNVKSTNGTFNLTFTHTLKIGMYELLIISGENGIYQSSKLTTVLKI